MKFGECNEGLFDGAVCSSCKQTFHYNCIGITEGGYRKLHEPSRKMLEEIKTMSSRMTAFEELVSQIKLMRDEFSGLISSVVDASTIIKDFGLRLQNIEDRLLDVEKTKELINNLQSRLDGQNCERDAAEQRNRMNNVELKGIPQTANENLLDLIVSIGSKTAVKLYSPHTIERL
ncbi:unnamed protein product [Pieris brassicae]|uniref:Zinc finger PHD-type domain-containing protein n=1 Tax=Pieris brassicae TaxID=7116 RepID=A0A9P0TDI0_PIEBR|nr:unnamed protein product [Pieris brassicae]